MSLVSNVCTKTSTAVSFAGGPVTCSPNVGTDGTVFVGTLDNHMYAFRPDGTVKWSRDLGAEIWSHPAIGGSLVYVGIMLATDFNAFALDVETGEGDFNLFM